MKTQSGRLENLEKRRSPGKAFYVITQVPDSPEVYIYKNKETGQEERMTLEEAKERFKDGNLLYVTYSNDWKKHERKAEENGDFL